MGVQQSGSLFKFNLSTGAAVWSGGNGVFWGLAFVGDSSCWPDCNSSGALTVADFACFQARFVIGDWYADCNFDSQLNIADFGCFQTKYAAGCP